MRTPEEIAEALVFYSDEGDGKWRHYAIVGSKVTRFNDELEARDTVKCHRRMIADAIRDRDDEWVQMALADAPVSAERMAEIKSEHETSRGTTTYAAGITRVRLLDEMFDLIDHLQARVALLSRDTGYTEGYAAGRAAADREQREEAP